MKGHRIIADEVLSCTIHAHRPITVNELRYMMALTPGETKIDPDALPEEEDLTAFCAGLVQIDPESQTIRMVHYIQPTNTLARFGTSDTQTPIKSLPKNV